MDSPRSTPVVPPRRADKEEEEVVEKGAPNPPKKQARPIPAFIELRDAAAVGYPDAMATVTKLATAASAFDRRNAVRSVGDADSAIAMARTDPSLSVRMTSLDAVARLAKDEDCAALIKELPPPLARVLVKRLLREGRRRPADLAVQSSPGFLVGDLPAAVVLRAASSAQVVAYLTRPGAFDHFRDAALLDSYRSIFNSLSFSPTSPVYSGHAIRRTAMSSGSRVNGVVGEEMRRLDALAKRRGPEMATALLTFLQAALTSKPAESAATDDKDDEAALSAAKALLPKIADRSPDSALEVVALVAQRRPALLSVLSHTVAILLVRRATAARTAAFFQEPASVVDVLRHTVQKVSSTGRGARALVRAFGPEGITKLAIGGIFDHFPAMHLIMAALPPRYRLAVWQSQPPEVWHIQCWNGLLEPPHPKLLATLPAPVRAQQAQKALATMRDNVDGEKLRDRWEYVALLPFKEAVPAAKYATVLAPGDANVRVAASIAALQAASVDVTAGAAAGAAYVCDRIGEREPLRVRLLHALAAFRHWPPTSLPIVRRVLDAALSAGDRSGATDSAVRNILCTVLRSGGSATEWALTTILELSDANTLHFEASYLVATLTPKLPAVKGLRPPPSLPQKTTEVLCGIRALLRGLRLDVRLLEATLGAYAEDFEIAIQQLVSASPVENPDSASAFSLPTNAVIARLYGRFPRMLKFLVPRLLEQHPEWLTHASVRRVAWSTVPDQARDITNDILSDLAALYSSSLSPYAPSSRAGFPALVTDVEAFGPFEPDADEPHRSSPSLVAWALSASARSWFGGPQPHQLETWLPPAGRLAALAREWSPQQQQRLATAALRFAAAVLRLEGAGITDRAVVSQLVPRLAAFCYLKPPLHLSAPDANFAMGYITSSYVNIRSLGVLGRLDDGQGIETLMAHAASSDHTGAYHLEPVKVALGALGRALRFRPVPTALEALRPLALLGGVSRSKALIRLLRNMSYSSAEVTTALLGVAEASVGGPPHRDVRSALIKALWDRVEVVPAHLEGQMWACLSKAAADGMMDTDDGKVAAKVVLGLPWLSASCPIRRLAYQRVVAPLFQSATSETRSDAHELALALAVLDRNIARALQPFLLQTFHTSAQNLEQQAKTLLMLYGNEPGDVLVLANTAEECIARGDRKRAWALARGASTSLAVQAMLNVLQGRDAALSTPIQVQLAARLGVSEFLQCLYRIAKPTDVSGVTSSNGGIWLRNDPDGLHSYVVDAALAVVRDKLSEAQAKVVESALRESEAPGLRRIAAEACCKAGAQEREARLLEYSQDVAASVALVATKLLQRLDFSPYAHWW